MTDFISTEEVSPYFISTKEAATLLGVSKTKLKVWRLGKKGEAEPRLIENVHWIPMGERKVLFHRELMIDFVANLNRPKVHERAVMAYLASLPSSKAVM